MNLKFITPVLNAMLVVACVTHISINAYDRLYPSMPSVKEYKTDLANVDFPISFKICLKEIKNKNERYEKYGYESYWEFFYGHVKNRKNFVGWNGDFENNSSWTVKGT